MILLLINNNTLAATKLSNMEELLFHLLEQTFISSCF